ncbi:hypothetical protein [Roseateles sp.]|uniref:hypothetical protein n=1 Tax=Roseateles sp. TaxID=1971397 RepID=UPI00286CCB1B|nr:hypothetical protein [Roseateles sp.]
MPRDAARPVRTDLCGFFKVTTLEQAMDFYATRDTDPARCYPTRNGVVVRFNDLPAA